ncbi:MAG: hypothetical protein H7A23_12155 [Leptospiraceae bacterium]|nr:hypothetical protein [Leptospiraceae bacterium]MCP5495300.1 hypothetical protein [Leptospiraceae bacterium]
MSDQIDDEILKKLIKKILDLENKNLSNRFEKEEMVDKIINIISEVVKDAN